MARKSLLPTQWEIPKILRERLGNRPGRQRAMLEEGHLLLVLHAPPGPDDDTREGRFFWREPNGAWHTTIRGVGVVELQQHIEEFHTKVEEQEEAEHRARHAGDYFKILRHLTPLKRTSKNLYNTLQQAREMVPSEHHLLTCRDEAYVLDREAELLLDEVQNGLQHYLAKQAEQQANESHQMVQAGHRLNVLVAIFFPLATLASLFGMNIKHGLEETPPPLLFLLVLTAGLAMGLVLKSTFFGHSPKNGGRS